MLQGRREKINISKKIFIAILFLVSICSWAFAETKVANDPTRISVGARSLGMGKTFVGISDDISSVFINPAGLSNIDPWQFTSMAGKFINEINYVNLGYAYPFSKGTLAIAYVSSNLGFLSPSPTIDTVDGIRIIPSTTEGVSYNYDNNALLIACGVKLKDFLNFSILKNISLGTTIKLFSQSLAGPDISNGSARGKDLDVGLLFEPSSFLRLGFAGHNVLPFDMGGKMVWGSGVEESLPSTLTFGSSFNLLGEKGLTKLGSNDLLIGLDYDISSGSNTLPGLLHFGIQWSPVEILDLRMGLDQDLLGTSNGLETYNNFTAGVGFLLNGYRFDYAYHQYCSVSDNDTHYFSISYGLWKTKPEPEKQFDLLFPEDNIISYEDSTKITGVIHNKKVKQIVINEIDVPIKELSFEATFSLELGKNSFLVLALDEKGKIIEKEKIRILRFLTFKDIPNDYWAKSSIDQMATLDIVTGYPDETFRPENRVSRAEFATLLFKVKGLQGKEFADYPYFNDVPSDYWAIEPIKTIAKTGDMTGYPDGTFRPMQSITRIEGIAAIARFGKLYLDQPIYEVPFIDINGRNWAIKEINAAKAAGYLKFLDKKLEPKKALTRAEVVEILSHTKFISKKTEDLMNWEK